jgi:hypothetical protein
MDYDRWTELEVVLDKHGVRPLVAVVPSNRDPVLQIDSPHAGFWELVHKWQSKGWTIGMHGYEHVFHEVDRKKLMLPFYDRSEFAGLNIKAQSAKIRLSWETFQAHGISPTVWIAPAHCFDRTTLLALKTVTPIRIVSDGIAYDQYFEDGFHWLPQQLWSLSNKTSGFWTVCLHPNSMDSHAIENLDRQLSGSSILQRIVSISDIKLIVRERGWRDKAYAFWFWRRGHVYKWAGAVRRHLHFFLRNKVQRNL